MEEKENKVINIATYKTKEQKKKEKDLLEQFYKLSDHLDD